jgi:hypothetical protein
MFLNMELDSQGSLDWYGVRLVFRVLSSSDPLYEERITIWRATSLDHAVSFAEVEAADYADPDTGLFEYVGLAQAFEMLIPNESPQSGDEVFSLMRGSELDADDYLNRFFDTGTEHQRTWEESSVQEKPASE